MFDRSKLGVVSKSRNTSAQQGAQFYTVALPTHKERVLPAVYQKIIQGLTRVSASSNNYHSVYLHPDLQINLWSTSRPTSETRGMMAGVPEDRPVVELMKEMTYVELSRLVAPFASLRLRGYAVLPPP